MLQSTETAPLIDVFFYSSFHDDVPKDYRQVSLTAVKQRFEDERYDKIGKEEVLFVVVLLLFWNVLGS